jgi:hypothetical protein
VQVTGGHYVLTLSGTHKTNQGNISVVGVVGTLGMGSGGANEGGNSVNQEWWANNPTTNAGGAIPVNTSTSTFTLQNSTPNASAVFNAGSSAGAVWGDNFHQNWLQNAAFGSSSQPTTFNYSYNCHQQKKRFGGTGMQFNSVNGGYYQGSCDHNVLISAQDATNPPWYPPQSIAFLIQGYQPPNGDVVNSGAFTCTNNYMDGSGTGSSRPYTFFGSNGGAIFTNWAGNGTNIDMGNGMHINFDNTEF